MPDRQFRFLRHQGSRQRTVATIPRAPLGNEPSLVGGNSIHAESGSSRYLVEQSPQLIARECASTWAEMFAKPRLNQQYSDHANHSQSQKPLLYNPEELPCEQAHDLVEVVAAPQNPLIHTNDDIGIRFVAGCRPLFNSVKGLLGGMTKH